MKEGYVVVAVDLRGTGETAAARPNALFGDSKSYFLAYLLGQSLVGLQTEDALTAGRFIAYYKTTKPRKVHVVAVGRAGIAALHAAALEPDAFASVTLRRTLAAWSPLITQPVPAGQLTTTIHGALRAYDLPDLARSLDATPIKIDR